MPIEHNLGSNLWPTERGRGNAPGKPNAGNYTLRTRSVMKTSAAISVAKPYPFLLIEGTKDRAHLIPTQMIAPSPPPTTIVARAMGLTQTTRVTKHNVPTRAATITAAAATIAAKPTDLAPDPHGAMAAPITGGAEVTAPTAVGATTAVAGLTIMTAATEETTVTTTVVVMTQTANGVQTTETPTMPPIGAIVSTQEMV